MVIKSIIGITLAMITAILAIKRDFLVSFFYGEDIEKEVIMRFEDKLEDDLLSEWNQVDDALVFAAWTNDKSCLQQKIDEFRYRWDKDYIKRKYHLAEESIVIDDIMACEVTMVGFLANFERHRNEIINDPRYIHRQQIEQQDLQ